MIEFIWDPKFKRSYKKTVAKHSTLKAKFNQQIKLFQANPFDPKLKTHKLSGTLQDCWAFSIEYDCRVIFKFNEKDRILLIDIGTHEEVY